MSITASRRVARRTARGAALLPLAFGTLGATAAGRSDTARGWWAAGPGDAAPTSASRPRLLVQGLLTIPLGLLALIPVGIEILFVLRGVLYGFVDHGQYDHSWGGPTRGGAWLAHFAISVPFAIAGIAALWGLDRLSARLANRLTGRRVGFWPYAAVVVASIGGLLLFVSWLHQI
jgi:hypothetical protein